MTYSHNSVSENLKMTSAAAATPTTIRLKNVSNIESGGGYRGKQRFSPPTTPPATAHSNSIASSTNDYALSTSPPGCYMYSGASSLSSCSSSYSSTSSLGSSGNGSGGSYFAQRDRQRQQQQQRKQQQQQRQSPQQMMNSVGNGGGAFFSNNQPFYQNNHQSGGQRRSPGSGSKQRDGQRSPSNAPMRQSPAIILGGGFGNGGASPNGSARKNRSSKQASPNHNSPLICGSTANRISPLIPTALTHFAGSKCFDAPSPTALPKPPQHWTLSKSEQKTSSIAGPGLHGVITARCAKLAMDAHTYGGHVVKTPKRNLLDDFDTHNLKLLLNVQS